VISSSVSWCHNFLVCESDSFVNCSQCWDLSNRLLNVISHGWCNLSTNFEALWIKDERISRGYHENEANWPGLELMWWCEWCDSKEKENLSMFSWWSTSLNLCHSLYNNLTILTWAISSQLHHNSSQGDSPPGQRHIALCFRKMMKGRYTAAIMLMVMVMWSVEAFLLRVSRITTTPYCSSLAIVRARKVSTGDWHQRWYIYIW